MDYNAFNVYCRELAPGTVSLTGDRAQGADSNIVLTVQLHFEIILNKSDLKQQQK